jgi:hypothetical protein
MMPKNPPLDDPLPIPIFSSAEIMDLLLKQNIQGRQKNEKTHNSLIGRDASIVRLCAAAELNRGRKRGIPQV